MKLVLFGTSKFSELVAKKILASGHQIIAIVSQPDKVNARKNKIIPSEMKVFAEQNNIPIYQFQKLNRDGEEILKNLQADIFVTASYGQIIKQNILDICPIINVHGSLLPKYRGPAPIQWCLINGETQTGISIMRTELGLDCGEVYLTKTLQIMPDDTSDSLFEKLGVLGGEAIVEFMDNYDNLIKSGTPQNESEMTYYPMLNKEMSLLNFDKNSNEIVNLIRGLSSCMPTYFIHNDLRYKILFATKLDKEKFNNILKMNNLEDKELVAGFIINANSKSGLIIKTKDGAIEVEIIQPEGKNKMNAKDFCNSGKFKVGEIL